MVPDLLPGARLEVVRAERDHALDAVSLRDGISALIVTRPVIDDPGPGRGRTSLGSTDKRKHSDRTDRGRSQDK
jgi:hypothetical protein